MNKVTNKSTDIQEKNNFSFQKSHFAKSVTVDFNAPDISSNGGLMFCDMHNSLAAKIGRALPDAREKAFVKHSYEEMVCQRVGQVMCGYEDANDSDSHFCSHNFMDWAHGKHYVEFLTGLSGNTALLKHVEKACRMAMNSYKKHEKAVCRYYSFRYKANSWKYEQRVIAKVEYNSKGDNVRFIVTSNRNNTPETMYRRYCRRGEMELWIKDLKYFRSDRLSCSAYRANYFRLFLYAAAYTMAYGIKHKIFTDTEVEKFTMDSFMKRIMLSAVYIVEKKTFIRVSFSPKHRHRELLSTALQKLTA